jgi:hypothetical protein
LDDLLGELNKNAAGTPALRTLLISAVSFADESLLKAQQNYALVVGKTLDPHPISFADFHQRYQPLLIELRTPRTGSTYRQGQPFLLEVQMTKRPPAPTEFPNYHGTYPPDAEQTITLFEENIAFYHIIEKTGSDTFTIKLASIPPGATISYAHNGETFRLYSSPTDVPNASFPLARSLFQFEKDRMQNINPERRSVHRANP